MGDRVRWMRTVYPLAGADRMLTVNQPVKSINSINSEIKDTDKYNILLLGLVFRSRRPSALECQSLRWCGVVRLFPISKDKSGF